MAVVVKLDAVWKDKRVGSEAIESAEEDGRRARHYTSKDKDHSQVPSGAHRYSSARGETSFVRLRS